MYIEKPNRIEVKNAMANPPIQNPIPAFGMSPIPYIVINCLPLLNVVELQKQLSNAPITPKEHTSKMPIAEVIATNLPSHREMTAPVVHHERDRDRVETCPGSGRDMWARILDARKRKNDRVPITPYSRNESEQHPKPTGGDL